MLKKITSFSLFVALFIVLSAQSPVRLAERSAPINGALARGASTFEYGNDWYDPTLTYAKIRVAEDGVYQVSSAELSAIGFPTSGYDLNNLHLMYRGVETPIHVVSNAGALQYIEFFGKQNDGKVDSILYRNPYSGVHDPDQQPVERLSLFTDTSAYYLTYNNVQGQRYQTFNDQNYQNYTPEPDFRYQSFHYYHPATGGQSVDWNNGGGSQYDLFHILNSYYITGEGFVGRAFGSGNDATIVLPTPHPANSGNPSLFSCRVYGRSSWQHILSVSLDGNQTISDTTSNVYIHTRSAQYTNTLGSSVTMIYSALGTQNSTDNNNYCWSSLEYDRLFDMDGENSIEMYSWLDPANAYLRFENSDVGSQSWVYDLTNNVRSTGTASNGISHIVVPGATNSRQLYVVTDNGIKTAQVEAPQLNNLKNINNGAPMVIIAHRSLASSAIAYANYRDTCTFNQLATRVVYTDEIYDEFSYGSITPLAIKRFCKYAIDNWTEQPKYFLLWGKGQYEVRDHPNNMVPTYGYPACDYDFVSDFDQTTTNVVPEASIGRVNVYTNDDGIAYLDKVNEYEHTPWEEWMKQTVFLGGGNDTTEQKPILDAFYAYYIPSVESAPFGGTGNYYQKFNTGLISNSSLTSTQRINAGASVIHFFGHSSSNIYDVDIQEPVLYSNYGKYPFMVAFGCYGGNFTGDGKSFGERFVLERERGSIGYLANSTAGYLTPLKDFGKMFYPKLYNDNFGDPIGDVIREAISDYSNSWTDQVHLNHAKQMNLQGDPSITLYFPEKPDLEITDADIFFTPEDFSASDSSFTINVATHNLGLVTQDSFYLSIRQQIPSGTWITYPKTKHGPVVLLDTLQLEISNTIGTAMTGLNTFDIFVDSTDVLDEYREDNNRVFFQKLIPGNIPAILYPYKYAVVDQNEVTLSASSFVINRNSRVRYIYEIDTVVTFNSPLYLNSGVIEGTASYSEWSTGLTLQDSAVYYWRVRLADINPASWASSSFKYIPTKVGWAQSRPPQFFEDVTTGIEMDEINYEWKFDTRSVELHAFVDQGGHGNYRLANGAFFNVVPGSSSLNGIMYTPIRSHDLIPTIVGTTNGDWTYAAMPDAQGDIVTQIASLPHGDYFMAVSENNPKVPQWADFVVDAFAMIGCDTNQIRSIPNNNSFIIFGRKGYPNAGIVISEPNVYDEVSNVWKFDLRVPLHTNLDQGSISSTEVGPAMDWNELIWDWRTNDAVPHENVQVSLHAVRNDGTDSLILAELDRGNYPLGAIDATRFPYMRLDAVAHDSVYLTAPQLDNWHVLFTPAPDVAIDPITNWSFVKDSVMRGEDITVSCSALNVSITDMDSLLVKFMVQFADRSSRELGRRRYAPVDAGETLTFDFDFNTSAQDMLGDLSFYIELNPEDDQPEQYKFNNTFTYPFYVIPDGISPIMDVTFDGKHLMEGDITSPTPEILVEINDENEFLAIGDSAYEVYFGPKTPNPNNLPRVFISGNDEMETEAASLPENKARLYFRPDRLDDGEYTFRVQGFDANGNAAGKTEYEINFEVVNESTVSNVLNYPNPFSTSTKFVYTLTGNEIPEVFEIHIYTITGRLVKVVDLHETNDVRFGKNMTDFAWDGRDEFGDLLANGVYVYKVVTQSNGQAMELRDEGITNLFNNGYGKLYIMR